MATLLSVEKDCLVSWGLCPTPTAIPTARGYRAMNLRFHWMLPKGGEVAVGKPQTAQAAARYRIQSTSSDSPAPLPDMEGWVHFAQHAEAAGIDSVLISFSRYEPDPFVVSCALGQATNKLKFIAAYRS